MLQFPTPFPLPGSSAFIASGADVERVTVLRRNADGSSLIAIQRRHVRARIGDASGNRTVCPGELFETEAEAGRVALRALRSA